MMSSNSVLISPSRSAGSHAAASAEVDRASLPKSVVTDGVPWVGTVCRTLFFILRIGVFLAIVLWPWQTVE